MATASTTADDRINAPAGERRSPSVAIVPLRRQQVGEAGAVLAASFAADPIYRRIFPDPARLRRAGRAFFGAAVGDALPFGETYGAVSAGRLVGVAVWLPPGGYPWGGRRTLRALPSLLPIAIVAPRSLPPLMRLGANVEQAFPPDPVWYLEVVGVVPEAQGQGVGRRLLAATLARADRDGVACYLETQRPETVRFYERLGFAVEREGVPLLPGGPTHWTMRRPPAGDTASGGGDTESG